MSVADGALLVPRAARRAPPRPEKVAREAGQEAPSIRSEEPAAIVPSDPKVPTLTGP